MGRIIGIDLGTTYSAVAIPEERTGEGFFTARECPSCTVIMDRLKNRITPSVVAEDERGEIVVGGRAKARAGFTPEPIMFAKRWMGEDKSFELNKQGVLNPLDVSKHILVYLKKMAEDRLGETVDEAVITVPAYFTLKAKDLTREAGVLAGLRVAQVAQEPVAAALMYCANDERDPLRIMTYDLGGGTFDVAILEKRDGTLSDHSVLSFDGNRYLGGYNFDRKVAFWIMAQLNAMGYDLQLDLEKAADREVFAKLMIYAERAKINLSKVESHEIQEPSTGIVDHSGNPVSIELNLTRDEFEAMIGKEVEETMELCHRAMSKAEPPVERDQLDEILMVGGSSRIPLVARRLEAEFGMKPKLVLPDLCVALGAAILAGTRAVSYGCLKLDRIPAETDLPSLTVTGRLQPDGSLISVDGAAVTLSATDNSYRNTRSVGAEGGFVFQNVTLAPEEQTDFIITVTSPESAEVASHRFSVRQTSAAVSGGLVGGPIGNVLSKPIGILLTDGFYEIAPERTPLPYEKLLATVTRDTSGTIRVPIVEENTPLGEIVMTDIPQTLAVGSTVEVKLVIQENYQIVGRAYVPAIGRAADVVIELQVRPQKSMDELRRDYETLSARAADAMGNASRGELFGGAKSKRLGDRLERGKEMLNSQAQDPAAVQDCLDEIESLVREVGPWKPEPARAVFNQKVSEAEDLLAKAISKKPAVAQDGYDRQLQAIRSEAEKALGEQNMAVWKDSFNKIVNLCDRLEAIAGDGPGDTGPPPDPAMILMSLERELTALEKRVKQEGRLDKFKDDFHEVASALKRIDPKASDALIQIRDWYSTQFNDLQRRLDLPEDEDLEGRVGLQTKKG